MASFWKRGQRKRIAKIVGIKPSHLSDILRRARGVSKERAKALETASEKVLGFRIPFEAWLFNDKADHPAFSTLESDEGRHE